MHWHLIWDVNNFPACWNTKCLTRINHLRYWRNSKMKTSICNPCHRWYWWYLLKRPLLCVFYCFEALTTLADLFMIQAMLFNEEFIAIYFFVFHYFIINLYKWEINQLLIHPKFIIHFVNLIEYIHSQLLLRSWNKANKKKKEKLFKNFVLQSNTHLIHLTLAVW